MAPSIRIPRLRHLRRGIRNLASTRLRHLKVWCAERSTTLDSTGTSQDYTIASAVTNVLQLDGHGFTSGDGPFMLTTGDTLATGLSLTTLYWVNAIDSDTFSLYTSYEDAIADVNRVDFDNDPAGTQSIVPATTQQTMVELIRQGNEATVINAETDIDNLIGGAGGGDEES